jgi:hypothetical protein
MDKKENTRIIPAIISIIQLFRGGYRVLRKAIEVMFFSAFMLFPFGAFVTIPYYVCELGLDKKKGLLEWCWLICTGYTVVYFKYFI